MKTGSGPALLLLHGLGCDHTTWAPVIESLARRYTVIAPDLLGHGASDKPRADYSVGGYANGMRDLLTVLGIDRVTVVGHSFGGGVAMQFAYQFPERERAAHPRRHRRPRPRGHAGDPGDHHARLPPGDGAAHAARCRHVGTAGMRALAATGDRVTRDLTRGSPTSTTPSRTPTPGRRSATSCARSSTGKGQIVTMADRAYLTEAMPMCVVWGRNDQVIPVRHAGNAAALAPSAPGSRSSPTRDTSRTRTTRSGSSGSSTTSSARPSPRSYDRDHWRDAARGTGPHLVPLQAEAGDAPVAPVHTLKQMGTGA